MDYFHTDCIKSYFEIVAVINRGNRFLNEQTEAQFFIEDKKLYLGVNTTQKYLLCIYDKYWKSSGSVHAELEIFICKLLRDMKPSAIDINEYIKRNLFHLPK